MLKTVLTLMLGLFIIHAAARMDPPAGYPNARNTGPAGAGLSYGDLTSGGTLHVTQAGAVVENMDINGIVYIEADNVTLRNCRVKNGSYFQVWNKAENFTMEYCELAGVNPPSGSESIRGTHYTARYCNIGGCDDGMKCGDNTTIEFCYIHDLLVSAGSHNDGIQATDGTNIIIRNNSILSRWQDQTSAIILKTDSGPIRNALIENNFLSGGNFTVYLRNGGSGAPTGCAIRNNIFEKDSYNFGILSTEGSVTYECNYYHTGDLIPENSGQSSCSYPAPPISTTAAEAPDAVPADPVLAAAPNPFNPATTVTVRMDGPGNIKPGKIFFYDINGGLIEALSLPVTRAGNHCVTVQWDASAHPSGVYVAKAVTGGRTIVKRLILSK